MVRARRLWICGASLVALMAAPSVVRADVEQGKAIYAKLRCSMCHKVEGSGGKKGPDLTDVGMRRDAAWLHKYLPNPKSVDPKATMPPVKASHDDLDRLVDYLLTLKGSH